MGDESKIKKISIAAVLFIAVAASILVGIALVDQYSLILRTSTDLTEVLFTLGAENVSTRFGTSGQYPFLQSLTTCINGSSAVANNVLPAASYTIEPGVINTGGFVTLIPPAATEGWPTEAVNCSMTYLADSNGQSAADAFVTGLQVFGTFAAVIALAIVGAGIVSLFSKKRQ